MNDQRSPGTDPLPPSEERRLDKLCDRFEAALKAGRCPRIERYLRRVPGPLRPELLRELLALELEYRSRRGETPRPQEYRPRFPEQPDLIDTVFAEAAQSTPPPSKNLLAKWAASRLLRQARERLLSGEEDEPDPSTLSALRPPPPPAKPAAAAGEGRPAADSLVPTRPVQPERAADESTVPDRPPPGGGSAPSLVLGDYELLELLGKGGMGVVYRARQQKLNRIVAFKLIRPDRLKNLAPEKRREWLERFRREAQAAARSEHAHVVTVYDVGEINGQPYYTMRYVEGRSLAAVCREGPLPCRGAVAYLEPVARAVHHVHACGVWHRDLKPRNILIDVQDRPLVADFGLALWQESGSATMLAEGPLGTPSYMSPEQVRQPDRIGAASDIYSLGATLYDLVTGRPPFEAADFGETLRQVQEDDPVPPRRLNPAIDRDLETITLKCLQKDPARRYASAEALADDLRRYLNREPVQARPLGTAERLWRWARRNPALAAAIGLAALCLVVALGVSTSFAIYQSYASTLLTNALAESEGNRGQLLETTKKSAHLAFRQGLNLCEQGDAAAGMLWLGQSLEIATRADDNDLERVIRLNLDGWRRQVSPLRAILPHESAVLAVAFSPDGKMILTGSKNHTAQLWDAATAKAIGPALKHQDPVHAVGFSPDGKTIITGSGDSPNMRDMRGEARLWEASTGQLLGPCLRHHGPVLAVAFSPDGQSILTASWDKTAKLWDTATGELRATLEHRDVVRAVAFSPDGHTILTGSSKAAQLWDVATGKIVGQCFPHQAGKVLSVAFSPNGKTVATGSEDRTARLWDVVKGQLIGPPLEHQDAVFAVGFSPDGLTVLTGSSDKTVRFWHASTCKAMSAPLRHQGKVLAAVFSSDSKAILTGSDDATARVWDAAAGRCPNRSLLHQDSVWAVAFSPDGQRVLTGSWDKTARLWDAVTGRPIGQPLRHQDEVWAVAVSPDGSTVLTASRDRTGCLWNAMTGEKLLQLDGHLGMVHAAAFSPDGKTIVTASADRMARLWETATGRSIGQPLFHPDELSMVAFSPDGQTVVTGCGDNIARLWDAATGRLTQELRQHGRGVLAVVFSPDGRNVLTVSIDRTAQVWALATAMPVGSPLVHQDNIWAAAFSPDGMTIGTASRDGTARLWDAGTGLPTCRSLEHQGEVWTLAFSPNSKTLLTGSKDSTARFWDVATGSPVGPCLQHQGPVWAVCFSPDGKTVLTGSRDKTAGLWQAPAPVNGDVGQIVIWTKVITATELDQGGTLRVLDAKTWHQYRIRLEELGGLPAP